MAKSPFKDPKAEEDFISSLMDAAEHGKVRNSIAGFEPRAGRRDSFIALNGQLPLGLPMVVNRWQA